MHRRFQYVGQVQSQTNPGPIERRPWNQDCGEADGRLTQHSAALSAQYPPQGASRPGVASNGGEEGGGQEAVLRLQGQLLGHAPFREGHHRSRGAESAYIAEVL